LAFTDFLRVAAAGAADGRTVVAEVVAFFMRK
jgi:hypothetical protein